MTQPAAGTARAARLPAGVLAIAALIFGVGIWLRSVALGQGGFWLDEVFSASFAQLSAAGTVLSVVLFDVHPPLYYLQLNAWGRLGHGDFWLLLNSVFWSAGTLLAVFFGVNRRFGSRCAVLALALCAVSGSEIYFAHELRMYAMYSCLCVLSWIAAERLRADYGLRAALPLVILLAAVGAIHGASLIGISAVLLYALPTQRTPDFGRRLRAWFVVSFVVMCAYLPWAINSSHRRIFHAAPLSLAGISQTLSGWALGYSNPQPLPWLSIAATVLILACLIAAVRAVPALQRLVLCFVAWPLVFGVILCLAVQPIWLDRTFAFCAPFVAIILGVALGSLRRTEGAGFSFAAGAAVAALVVIGGWFGYREVAAPYKPDRYDRLAQYLAGTVQGGDIIYAPYDATFWGLNRYLVGPDWGSILVVQDAAELNRLKKWQRLTAWFGTDAFGRAGLAPETRELERFRVPIYTGSTPLPPSVRGHVIWFVDSTDAQQTDLSVCGTGFPTPVAFGRLRVFRLQCPPAP